MGLPTKPVTLDAAQIKDLSQNLSNMRHDINNCLSLILAGVELARHNPEMVKQMIETLSQQPRKISDHMSKFSVEFEKTLGISRF